MVSKELAMQGWRVLRFWEREILKNTEACVIKVKKEINRD